jgi:hypothetical protein
VLQRLGVGVVVVEDEATAKQEMVAMLAETAVIDVKSSKMKLFRCERCGQALMIENTD